MNPKGRQDAPGDEGPAAGRRRARELALQILYAIEVSGEPSATAMDAVIQHEHAQGEEAEYARTLVQGTIAERPRIDPMLERWSESWTLGRMAAVDRNLLRLAAYELLGGQVPRKVVINEAVEIAKRFGDQKSPAFVNAILDKIGREPQTPSAAQGPSPPSAIPEPEPRQGIPSAPSGTPSVGPADPPDQAGGSEDEGT